MYGNMGYYGYGYDWTYLMVLAGAILTMIASAKVNSTFQRYAKVRSMSGMTGAQVAAMETKTLENGYIISADNDLLSAGCTIQITGIQAVVAEAAANAN